MSVQARHYLSARLVALQFLEYFVWGRLGGSHQRLHERRSRIQRFADRLDLWGVGPGRHRLAVVCRICGGPLLCVRADPCRPPSGGSGVPAAGGQPGFIPGVAGGDPDARAVLHAVTPAGGQPDFPQHRQRQPVPAYRHRRKRGLDRGRAGGGASAGRIEGRVLSLGRRRRGCTGALLLYAAAHASPGPVRPQTRRARAFSIPVAERAGLSGICGGDPADRHLQDVLHHVDECVLQ